MSPDESTPFDLAAYLARIGVAGPYAPTTEVLDRLHLAHATTIPFENLDLLLGLPIRIDLESLQAKLVRGRRGGYCFEQNTLFAAALEAVGFRVTPLAARVRFGGEHIRPRTHMLLKVDLDDGPRLADVGFGGEGLLWSIPMVTGREARQSALSYRIVEEDDALVLQSIRPSGPFDLYSFTTERQYPIDYEMANYYTSTHPSSIFRKSALVQRPTPEARYVLYGRVFFVDHGGETTRRVIVDDAELLGVLAENFGLDFPPGTRFGPEVDPSAPPPLEED